MKQLFTLILILAGFMASAQYKVKQDANGNFISVVNTTARDSTTGKTFTDTKGNKYPVYISRNGKYYIIRTSGRTGNQYKSYLKID